MIFKRNQQRGIFYTDRSPTDDAQIGIFILFLLSGVCGLVYEVAWTRMLTLIFGTTTLAVSTILVSFMVGLALGSFYFGKLIDRHRDPLRIYGYLEGGIGAFALLTPFIFIRLINIYTCIYQQFHASLYLFNFVRFILSFAVLLIPTALMGGTLPVLSKIIVRRLKETGWKIGSLYSINTFGAVIGCFATGFFLIGWLGVRETIYSASIINFFIAGIILLVYRGLTLPARRTFGKKDTGQVIHESGESSYSRRILFLVVSVFALSGFCAFSYEVLWTRLLVFICGNSTYAFSVMLSTFLTGLALGSYIFARFSYTEKHLLVRLGLIEVGIGVFALLSLLLFKRLYVILPTLLTAIGGIGWWRWVGVRFIAAFSIILIPTLLMGGTFPIVSRIYTISIKMVGYRIGKAYSMNTIGAALGAFATGFALIPLLGIQKSIVFIACINIGIGGCVLFFDPRVQHKRKVASLAGIIGIMSVSLLFIKTNRPIVSYSTVFRSLNPGAKLLYYKEGIGSTVTVVDTLNGPRELYVDVNRAADTSRWDAPSHKIIGHLPALLHPNPKSALVIGFGTGITSYTLTLHDVKVEGIEISPEVIAANRFFVDVNHHILENPKVKVIIDDGRNYVISTDKKYDIISSGIIHPALSEGSANFYSKDFYKACKKILTEDGVMCQWVPLHRMPLSAFKMIIRTFINSFPHTTLWYKYTSDFIVLIGTRKKLLIDFKSFSKRMQCEQVKLDLETIDMTDPFALLDSFMMSEETLRKYVGKGLIHTDNNPYMEFSAPKCVGTETTYLNLQSIAKWREPVFPFLTNIGENEQEVSTVKAMLQKYFKGTQHTIRGQLFGCSGKIKEEIAEYLKALHINPEDRNTEYLLENAKFYLFVSSGDKYLKMGDLYKASVMFREALKIKSDSAIVHNILGIIYNQIAMYSEAINEFKEALRIKPYYASAHLHLASIYLKKGMVKEANKEIEKVRELSSELLEMGY